MAAAKSATGVGAEEEGEQAGRRGDLERAVPGELGEAGGEALGQLAEALVGVGVELRAASPGRRRSASGLPESVPAW